MAKTGLTPYELPQDVSGRGCECIQLEGSVEARIGAHGDGTAIGHEILRVQDKKVT